MLLNIIKKKLRLSKSCWLVRAQPAAQPVGCRVQLGWVGRWHQTARGGDVSAPRVHVAFVHLCWITPCLFSSWLMEREGIMLIQFITGTLGTVITQVSVSARVRVLSGGGMSLHRRLCPTTGEAEADGRASENIPGPFLSSAPKANTAESLSLIPFSRALSKLHLRAARRRWRRWRRWRRCVIVGRKTKRGGEGKEEMKRVMDDYRPDGRKSGRKWQVM